MKKTKNKSTSSFCCGENRKSIIAKRRVEVANNAKEVNQEAPELKIVYQKKRRKPGMIEIPELEQSYNQHNQQEKQRIISKNIQVDAVKELYNQGILTKAKFLTKYKDEKTGKQIQKERMYFIGSVYQDTNVLTKSEFKNGFLIKKAIGHKHYGEEEKTPTTFATLFNLDKTNSIVIQQPYNGVGGGIFGVIYNNYHTLFYGKRDSYGEKYVGEIISQKRDELKSIKRGYAGYKKLYFGGKALEVNYLKQFDNYENRVKNAVNSVNLQQNEEYIERDLRNEFIKLYRHNNNDKSVVVNIQNISKNQIDIYSQNGFKGSFIIDKNAVLEKSGNLNCNEFVSVDDEKISSVFFYTSENSLDNFFTKMPSNIESDYILSAFHSVNSAEKAAKYNNEKFDREKFYKEYKNNFRNLVFCQKRLGLPYIPILCKNKEYGYRLENMKLSVFAEKVNEGLNKNRENYLFSVNDIEEFKQFEKQFIFEAKNNDLSIMKEEDILLEEDDSKDENIIVGEEEGKSIDFKNNIKDYVFKTKETPFALEEDDSKDKNIIDGEEEGKSIDFKNNIKNYVFKTKETPFFAFKGQKDIIYSNRKKIDNQREQLLKNLNKSSGLGLNKA